MRAFLTVLLVIFSVIVFAETSHCSKNEKIVFSCVVNKKVVSICASQDLSPTTGYMQYRFGKIGALEIQIPKLNEHPFKSVEADAYQAASGQNGFISFKSGEYLYVINWSSYRSDQNASNGSSIWLGESGLVVVHKEKEIANFKCDPTSDGDVLEVDPYYLHSQVGFPQNKKESSENGT